MNAAQRFNQLHRKTVWRGELRSIATQARREKDFQVVQRIQQLLNAYPYDKQFELTLKTPAEEILTPDLLHGIPKLTSNEEKELEGEGLAGVSQHDIYKMVNDLLLEAMEKHKGIPWRDPIESVNTYGKTATNFSSKKPYTGVNSLLLNLIIPLVRKKRWKIPFFLTFKQIEKYKGKLKKGAEGYPIIYYNYFFDYQNEEEGVKIKEYDVKQFVAQVVINKPKIKVLHPDGDKKAVPVEDFVYKHRFGYVRYYHVFNADDITGIDWKLEKIKPRTEVEKLEIAEQILQYMPKKPKIVHKDLKEPFYTPTKDFINIPKQEQFKPQELYHSTLFHELVHSTAHKKRLDDPYRLKKENYGFEEFVAEIGASYLNAEAGILFRTINDSATYINGWKKQLKEAIKQDQRFFLRAAAKAQNAADYILDRKQGEQAKYLLNSQGKEKGIAQKERKEKTEKIAIKNIEANKNETKKGSDYLKSFDRFLKYLHQEKVTATAYSVDYKKEVFTIPHAFTVNDIQYATKFSLGRAGKKFSYPHVFALQNKKKEYVKIVEQAGHTDPEKTILKGLRHIYQLAKEKKEFDQLQSETKDTTNNKHSLEEQVRDVLLQVKAPNKKQLVTQAKETLKKQIKGLPTDTGMFRNPLEELIREVVYAYNIFDKQYADGTLGYQSLKIPKPLKGIKEDIPFETAKQAYYWSSMSPERRGKSEQRNYFFTLMEAYYDLFRRVEDQPKQVKKLDELFANFRERYKKAFLAYLHAHSRVASTMVTGPANFPVRANEKKSETADKRMSEYIATYNKGIHHIKKELGLIQGSDAIVSGEEGTLELLEKKLAQLERDHALFKEVNQVIRKAKGNNELAKEQLQKMGLREDMINDILYPKYGGQGFATYQLSNNKQEISRLKDRITQEKRFQQRKEKSETAQTEFPFDGGKIFLNYEKNRLQIFFDNIPPVERRTELKKSGFKWARSEGVWQRQLTPNAIFATNIIFKDQGVKVIQANVSLNEHERVMNEGQLVISTYHPILKRRVLIYKIDDTYKMIYRIKNYRSYKIDTTIEPESISYAKLTNNGDEKVLAVLLEYKYRIHQERWEEFSQADQKSKNTKTKKAPTTKGLAGIQKGANKTPKKIKVSHALIESLGGMVATDNPTQVRPKVQLKGEIGKIISKIDRHMALILIKGNRHTSKSEFLMQLANAFGEQEMTVAYIDGEQGGLDASVTRECRDRNTTAKARPYITIFPAVREYDQLKQLAKAYDVILADSVQELGLSADQLGELRQAHKNTIFGFISMVKESGAMYGGNKMEHHPPMIFECHQGEYTDPTEKYKSRYVTCEKNRGNPEAIGLKYHIFQKKTEAIEDMSEAKKEKE